MHVRPRPLLLAAALLSSALLPLAGPASADAGPATLGMTTFADLVADEAHGQLFLSPGASGTGVRVTDLAGGSPRTVDGLPGATGMALTPDGRSLWVALPTIGALKKIDTATLAVTQTIGLPTGHCPGDVAVVGDRLAYGHSCSTYAGGAGSSGGVGVVDAATGTSYGALSGAPSYRPVVAAGPGGRVYAADAGLSPTGLFAYDVGGAAPVLAASRPQACSNLRDLSVSPDGSQVVTACGGTYSHTVWTAALGLSGHYPSGAYPVAGAWSGDGRTFVAGIDSAYEPDVIVHRLGENSPVRWADFGATTSLLQHRGLSVSHDGLRIWAVASTSASSLALHVLDVPARTAASLTATATPGAMYPGGTATVTGALVAPTGAPIPGEVLRVSRGATGTAPVDLPSVTTSAEGTFAFTDVPPTDGSYVYMVSRDADGARAEVPVLVWSTAGRLELSLSRGTTATPVQGTFRLYYQGSDSEAGVRVTIVREGGGLSAPVATVVTDSSGAGTFTDAPPAGDHVYRATAEASGVHPSSTATAATTVLTATSLTAKTPSTAAAGAPLPISGALRTADSPLAAATVAVSRSGCGTAWSGSTTTATDGAWSLSDPSPAVGTCRYTATYAGGGGYASSSAATSAVVSLPAPTLTASAPATATAGDSVAVTGRLTSGTAALSGAVVEVARSGCSTWAGRATTGTDGSWSVQDPGVPGGTCTWTAKYAGSSKYAATSTSTAPSTSVAFRTADLTLSVVRGTGSAKKYAYVTAQLGAWHTGKTLRITAQPAGGVETLLASGTVDSAGRLTATYQPKTTTTYRVTYAGDDWYAPAKAERVQ